MGHGVGGPDRLGEGTVEIPVIAWRARVPGGIDTLAKITIMMAAAGRTTSGVARMAAVVATTGEVEREGGDAENTRTRVKRDVQVRGETASEKNANNVASVVRRMTKTKTSDHPPQNIGAGGMRGIARLAARVRHHLTRRDTETGVIAEMKEAVVTGVRKGAETIEASTPDLTAANATGGTVTTTTMVTIPRMTAMRVSLSTTRGEQNRPRTRLRQPLLRPPRRRLPSR